MKKWDYKTIALDSLYEIETLGFDKHAEDGWELVSIFPINRYGLSDNGLILNTDFKAVFKREVEHKN